MKGNKLIIFAGPSGTGKTTIVKHLLATIPSLSFSISATTRQRRENENNGRDYYFLSLEDFKKKIENNEFVEYEEVYGGTFYGTLRSEINNKWEQGLHVIFDIDVVGALNLKKQFPENSIAVIVMPPSIAVLKDRLLKRGSETPESLIKRIGKAERELASADLFDCKIVNDVLEKSLEEARTLIESFIRS